MERRLRAFFPWGGGINKNYKNNNNKNNNSKDKDKNKKKKKSNYKAYGIKAKLSVGLS